MAECSAGLSRSTRRSRFTDRVHPLSPPRYVRGVGFWRRFGSGLVLWGAGLAVGCVFNVDAPPSPGAEAQDTGTHSDPDAELIDVGTSSPTPGLDGGDRADLGLDGGGQADQGPDAGPQDTGPLSQPPCLARNIAFDGTLGGAALSSRAIVASDGQDSVDPPIVRDAFGNFSKTLTWAGTGLADGVVDAEVFFTLRGMAAGRVFCASTPIEVAGAQQSGTTQDVRGFSCPAAATVSGTVEFCRRVAGSCPGGVMSFIRSSVEGLEFDVDNGVNDAFVELGFGDRPAVVGYRSDDVVAWFDEGEGYGLVYFLADDRGPKVYCVGSVERQGQVIVYRDLAELGTCDQGAPVTDTALSFCIEP